MQLKIVLDEVSQDVNYHKVSHVSYPYTLTLFSSRFILLFKHTSLERIQQSDTVHCA